MHAATDAGVCPVHKCWVAEHQKVLTTTNAHCQPQPSQSTPRAAASQPYTARWKRANRSCTRRARSSPCAPLAQLQHRVTRCMRPISSAVDCTLAHHANAADTLQHMRTSRLRATSGTTASLHSAGKQAARVAAPGGDPGQSLLMLR